MGGKVKISVLVPIYNVEEFLSECLDSLVNQTLKDIEIICINDGSTDGSLEIVKKYARKDKRIIIIDKNNSGYGDSMNQGLAKATGEYVGIVEPDDFIDLDAYETMYNLAKKNDVEVVKGNFYEYYGDKKIDKGISDLFLIENIGKVVDPRMQREIFYQPPCIWAGIYKNEFLRKNKIDFLPTPGAAYQDAGFNFKVWAMARRVYFVRRAFLHYRQDNANSSVKDVGKVYCVKDEHDSIEEFLKKNDLLSELGSVAFTCRFGGYVWNLHRLKFRPAMEFAKTVRRDYKRAKNAGYLDIKKLDDTGRHNVRIMAVKHPRLYVCLRPFHDLKNSMKPTLSKIMKMVLPRYRQRLRTIDALLRLKDAQDELSVKISKLESKIEGEEKDDC